jgi:oxygen-independent coproporphyrinogen-3 oxidase
MAGLYIHIPFCKSRCIYCGFYSTTDTTLRQRYVDAVCQEMISRSEKNEGENMRTGIQTIYIGGGTPSQLTLGQLGQLLEKARTAFDVDDNAEVTVEVNPDDVTEELAAGLQAIGVNRVSMGAQTFDANRLRFLNRRHTARQVEEAVSLLRQSGFDNISIDLMYGFPDETLNDWQQDIDAVLRLGVEHLSAYCLMIEEGTPLHQWAADNGQWAMDEELERAMYYTLIERLTAAGYEHYELSNFAKPGRHSRHNSSYWKDIPYIGLGAAAHSYDGQCRRWNVSNLLYYIKGIENGQPSFEQEELDEDTHYNDRITVALRTCEGLSLSELTDRQQKYLLRSAQRYLDDGLLELLDGRIKLTRKGLFVSDMVMADLMMV